MKIENKSTAEQKPNQDIKSDIKPLIDLFELLLEWDMKDVQEKEERSKKVS